MTKVRKAVIPAAGLGTRFYQPQKHSQKEMLPIVDKPTIQFIVEEALKSGIKRHSGCNRQIQTLILKTTLIQILNWR